MALRRNIQASDQFSMATQDMVHPYTELQGEYFLLQQCCQPHAGGVIGVAAFARLGIDNPVEQVT
jgi:hypothetical protein